MLFFALFFSLLIAFLGFLGLSDRIQLLVDLPKSFSYFVFAFRIPLIILGFGSFLLSMYLGLPILPKVFVGIYLLLFGYMFFVGFILQPYLMYPSKQYSARYTSIEKVRSHIPPEEAFLVHISPEGAAVAFPVSWMTRTRIVGIPLEGKELVMTYCILAHLGRIFYSDVEGKKIKFRVLNQLENNLVLFDENNQQLIEHIYGVFTKSRRPLDQAPSVIMPFASFQSLYPYGMVYFNPPSKGIWDRIVRNSLNRILHKAGGHLDPSNSDAAYPTIGYIDQRIPSKELVYGISIANQAVAFTMDYIKSQGDCLVETLGTHTFTLKYFPEYKFVDVFEGDVPDVDAMGITIDGIKAERIPHANQVVWLIWSHFYPHTELRS